MKFYKQVFLYAVFSLLLTAFAGTINAQVLFESATVNGNFATGGLRVVPITVSHTIPGITRILYVGVSNYRIPATFGTPCAAALPPTGSVTSVTFNGMAFERLTTQTTNLGAVVSPDFCNSVEIFRLKNPPATTDDVIVNQPTGGDYTVVGAISFFGVDQMTSANGAIVPNSGNSQFPNVTVGTAANDVVLDVLSLDFNSGIATPSQTLRWNGNNFFGFLSDIGAASTKSATGTSTMTNWTLGTAGNWALGGIRLQPLAASASLASIGGQVRRADGNALPSSLVILQNLNTGEQFYTHSDEKGRYIFEDQQVGVSYFVRVFNYKYDFTPNNQIFSLLDARGNVDFVGNIRRRNLSVSGYSRF